MSTLLMVNALAYAASPLPEPEPLAPASDAPGFRLRVATVSLGAAAGWQETCGGLKGRCRDWVALSPILDLSFEIGGRKTRLWAGVHSAPTYSYLLGYSTSGLALAELELGAMFGGPHIRAGVGAFGGFQAAGGVARAEITPWTGRHGRLHGFDVRAGVLAADGPAFQWVIAYTWTPWHRFGMPA